MLYQRLTPSLANIGVLRNGAFQYKEEKANAPFWNECSFNF